MDPVGEFALMILGPSAGRRTSLVSHVETLGPKDPDRLHTLTYCAPSWLAYGEGSETETGASVAETTVLFFFLPESFAAATGFHHRGAA